MTDLFLFFLILGKCALYTGLGPAILLVYGAEMLVRAYRVPARKLLGKVVSLWIPTSSGFVKWPRLARLAAGSWKRCPEWLSAQLRGMGRGDSTAFARRR